MTTSGTTAFDMDFTEIAEEAWERAGREMRSGYDLRTARRSMNLMTIEWQNRGINMWTIDSGTISITAGKVVYSGKSNEVSSASLSESSTTLMLSIPNTNLL